MAQYSSEEFTKGEFSSVEFDEGEFFAGKLFGHRSINYRRSTQRFLGIPVHMSVVKGLRYSFGRCQKTFLELRLSTLAKVQLSLRSLLTSLGLKNLGSIFLHPYRFKSIKICLSATLDYFLILSSVKKSITQSPLLFRRSYKKTQCFLVVESCSILYSSKIVYLQVDLFTGHNRINTSGLTEMSTMNCQYF